MLNFFISVKNLYMKRLSILIFLVFALFASTFSKDMTNPLFESEKVQSVCLVVDQGVLSGEIVQCGDKDFVYLSPTEAKKCLKKYQTYSLQFNLENVTLQELLKLLAGKVLFCQALEDLEIYYCYTPFEQNCVYMDGKKVNMQVAISDEKIVAGFPLILTGY